MNIPIKTETIDLDQLLKLAGIAGSGGEAKHLVQSNLVKVNGELETRRRATLHVGDVIEVETHSPITIVSAE
jgi:ribosome-associated protein